MNRVYLSPSDQNRNIYAWGNTNEMVQCRRIADACEAALRRCGLEVINNKYDTMEERVAESNAWNAELHVCIHTNAFNGSVSGTRIFASSLSSEGYRAAAEIFRALAPLTPGTSENIKPYPELYEIRRTTAPCAYVEAEFHDVPHIAEWIVGHTSELGEAIAQGICGYFGVEYIQVGDKAADMDGKPSGWALEAAEYCMRKGIISGDGEGGYNWSSPLTREAAAQIVYNTLKAAGLLDKLPDKA